MDALDNQLKTPLFDAVSSNDTDMANLLLDYNADPDLRVNGARIQDTSKSQEMDELLYYHEKDRQRGNVQTRGLKK